MVQWRSTRFGCFSHESSFQHSVMQGEATAIWWEKQSDWGEWKWSLLERPHCSSWSYNQLYPFLLHKTGASAEISCSGVQSYNYKTRMINATQALHSQGNWSGLCWTGEYKRRPRNHGKLIAWNLLFLPKTPSEMPIPTLCKVGNSPTVFP